MQNTAAFKRNALQKHCLAARAVAARHGVDTSVKRRCRREDVVEGGSCRAERLRGDGWNVRAALHPDSAKGGQGGDEGGSEARAGEEDAEWLWAGKAGWSEDVDYYRHEGWLGEGRVETWWDGGREGRVGGGWGVDAREDCAGDSVGRDGLVVPFFADALHCGAQEELVGRIGA